MSDQAPLLQASLHPKYGEGGLASSRFLFPFRGDSQLAASARSSVVLLTGPQIPQFYKFRMDQPPSSPAVDTGAYVEDRIPGGVVGAQINKRFLKIRTRQPCQRRRGRSDLLLTF